jgi:hypothetical protein
MKLTKEQFLALKPCPEAIKFAESVDFDFEKGWSTCERGDWMIWLIKKLHWSRHSNTPVNWLLIAQKCAEHVKHLNSYGSRLDAASAAAYVAAATYADAATHAAAATYAADAAAYTAAYGGSNYADYAAEKKWQADMIREVVKLSFE